MTQQAKTQVIMTFIHAGGAGKTTTTRDIGAELARRGYRILLVDLDPQANLTYWLGVVGLPVEQTIVPVLRDGAPLPAPQHAFGMDIIPSHLDLAQVDVLLAALHNPEGRLKKAIDKVRASGNYDFILLDAPPSLGKLTANGANAADWLIVPLPASRKGLDAIAGVREAIERYSDTNEDLEVAMYLVTQATHNNTSRDVQEAYSQLIGEQLAGPIIHRPAIYGDAQVESRPIKPKQKEAHAEIAAAVDTLLSRVQA